MRREPNDVSMTEGADGGDGGGGVVAAAVRHNQERASC